MLKQGVNKFTSEGLLSLIEAGLSLAKRRIKTALAIGRSRGIITTRGVKINMREIPTTMNFIHDIYYDNYEASEAEAISSYLNPTMDIIDLGAGIGFISCYSNRQISDSSSHIAVEPNPKVQQPLSTSKNINNCDFEILHAAYGYSEDEISIDISSPPASVSRYRPSTGEFYINTIDVQTIIDRFELSNTALIVDIEGAEGELLVNELPSLEKHCELLIVEFHHTMKDIDQQQRRKIQRGISNLNSSSFELIEDYGDVKVYRQQ